MKKALNRNKHKGGALLVAMIFLGVLTMVGISVTFTSSSQMMVSYNHQDMSDTFWSTNEALQLFLNQTAVGGKSSAVGDKDALLMTPAQSLEEKSLSDFSSSTILSMINSSISGSNPKFGSAEGDIGKKINISIKQKAKGAICPRAPRGSSVTKISCDHFDVYSRYDTGTTYKPGIQMGIYREMIHSNSATHRDLEL
ncbi:MAG: hypothetical protein D6B28_03560 [Gammaproteobacteria bacterium]|nr:MAG: hypothetical protein D6B28_03560 [Gammaproteobacteria bacterium]